MVVAGLPTRPVTRLFSQMHWPILWPSPRLPQRNIPDAPGTDRGSTARRWIAPVIGRNPWIPLAATPHARGKLILRRAWRFSPPGQNPPRNSRGASMGPSGKHQGARVHWRPYDHCRLSPANGSVRMRLPVAAKMALQTAGAAAGNPGSPKPVGAAADLMKCTSTTGGDWFMRNCGY